MKKTDIVCKPNESKLGVTFECGYCGKHIFVNSICKRKTCIRCDRMFRNKIVIKRDDA